MPKGRKRRSKGHLSRVRAPFNRGFYIKHRDTEEASCEKCGAALERTQAGRYCPKGCFDERQ